MGLQTPVLLIIFNRPDLTQKVFASIRQERPTHLFISADGPRNDDEKALTDAARAVTEDVDWPCQVKRRYSDQNQGCKLGPYKAISWAFEMVDELIILEDDCLPHPDFFSYCSELLERYKNDDRIMHISGDCFLPDLIFDSYYFTKFTHVWGWATYARSWSKIDINMTDWNRVRETNFLKDYLGSVKVAKHWATLFDSVAYGDPQIWDYQWTYAVWRSDGLCISPAVNLVSNIGFGKGATHTHNTSSSISNIKTGRLEVIHHPKSMVVNEKADEWIFNNLYHTPKGTFWSKLLRKAGL